MCRIWKEAFFTAFILSLILYGTVEATDFSSNNFVVKDPVIIPGAGFSFSSNFKLHSTLGQEAIGVSTGNTINLKSGFLYYPSPSTAPSVLVVPGSAYGTSLFAPPIPREIKGAYICDFNKDKVCNISDLSILLYWYDRPNSTEHSRFDINSDGRIDIADISVIFYFWT